MSARAVGRLSAQANGIRFGAVQRQEDAFRAELRSSRREAGAPGADLAAITMRLQALREQVERFAGQWLAPPPTQVAAEAASTAAPAIGTSVPQSSVPAPLAPLQVASIRQGVTRAMIVLAHAPLHLRLEFGTGFVDANPEPLLLAARMHAIHRAVRGSLKQVSWQTVDRAELTFGDGDPARTVDAVFDADGRLQVPDAVRQQPGRAAPALTGAAADRGQAVRGSRPQGGPGARPQGGPGARPQRSDRSPAQPRPAPKSPATGNQPPSPQAQRGAATHARPQRASDDTGRPGPASASRPAPVGGDRRASRPRAPINPLMADKLRAVLAGASGAKSASAAVDPPAPEGSGAPQEGPSD